MTIVELVDAHEGFAVITDRIKTTDKTKRCDYYNAMDQETTS